jgi:hypothetical protein
VRKAEISLIYRKMTIDSVKERPFRNRGPREQVELKRSR